MPIIRPERVGEVPVMQLQSPETNLMVGTASPRLEQARARGSDLAALLGGVLQGGLGTIQQLKPEYDAKAAVQGALAANTEQDPFSKYDEKREQVSMFFRDKYEEGYLNAAFNKEVAEYRRAANSRAQQSGLAGVPLQEYLAREREHAQEFSNKLAQYLPDMSEQTAYSALSGLEQTAVGARGEYEKLAASIAMQEQDRTLDLGLTAFAEEFSARVNSGDISSGLGSLKNGLQAILSSTHLEKDKKYDKAKEFFNFIANQYDDPRVIDALQQVAQSELGMNANAIVSDLRTQFNRAASQNTGKALFDLDAQVRRLSLLPESERLAGMNALKGNLLQYMDTGVVSPSTGLSMWTEANKAQDEANQKAALVGAIQGNLGSTAYSAMAGVDLNKARQTILDQFPDTPEGNWNMYTYAKNSHDTFIMDKSLQRLGDGASRLLSTMGSIANTPDGSVSDEMQGQWNTFARSVNGLSAGDRQQVLSYVPENRRFIVAQALEQDASNATGVMFDTLRRVQENEARGLYQAIPEKASQEMINPNSTLGFSSTSNWFSFGSEAKEQRAAGTQALQEEFQYVKETNPEVLLGLEDKDINALLKERIKARQGEVTVNGTDIHFYTPRGTSMRDFMQQGYTGSVETFTRALSERTESTVNALMNKDKIKNIRLEVGSAGAGADDFTVVVTSSDPSIPVQRARVSAVTVADDAQRIHDGYIKGQDEKARGLSGSRPVTFGDATTGRVVNGFVSGTNSIGMKPADFSHTMEHFMKFEGFLSKQKDMGDGRKTIGFGLHESSGIKLPESMTVDEAINSLSDDLQKHYIPTAKRVAESKGVKLDAQGTLLLTDLTRHGWTKQSEPVAQAMAEYQQYMSTPARAQYEAKLMEALKGTTAYKQSQSTRQKALDGLARAWAYNAYMSTLPQGYGATAR